MSPTQPLYNSVKLCKPFRYIDARGKNETTKREEVVYVFREGKIELLALTETKWKGEGEVSWRGINGIIAGVQETERTTKEVAILLNDV